MFSVLVEGLASTSGPTIRQGEQSHDTGCGSHGSLSPERRAGAVLWRVFGSWEAVAANYREGIQLRMNFHTFWQLVSMAFYFPLCSIPVSVIFTQ